MGILRCRYLLTYTTRHVLSTTPRSATSALSQCWTLHAETLLTCKRALVSKSRLLGGALWWIDVTIVWLSQSGTLDRCGKRLGRVSDPHVCSRQAARPKEIWEGRVFSSIPVGGNRSCTWKCFGVKRPPTQTRRWCQLHSCVWSRRHSRWWAVALADTF